MNLSKQKNERKLFLAKRYFYAGFAFLPFVWAINAVWFYKEAFMTPPYAEQQDIKKYVIRSGLGAILWAAALIAWNIVFQTNRVAWGETGDDLSFVIPQGRP